VPREPQRRPRALLLQELRPANPVRPKLIGRQLPPLARQGLQVLRLLQARDFHRDPASREAIKAAQAVLLRA
jgi:hypothetical protein